MPKYTTTTTNHITQKALLSKFSEADLIALLALVQKPAKPFVADARPAQVKVATKDLPLKEFVVSYTKPAPFTQATTTLAPFLTGDPNNVFVLPDLHCPFMRKNFLPWAVAQQRKYNCGTVVAIGDIVDGNSWNFHEKDPDGMSVGAELEATRQQLASVFAAFPTAFCCLGNHDLLVARKMKAIGLSEKFMKPFGEIFDAPPTWTFGHSITLDDVLYTHGGPGGKADRMAQHSRQSTVQGHYHAESYVHHYVSERDAIFAMQVGAAQDDKAYAFAYGRPFPRKSAIGCGVVLDSGKTPISLLMPL